MADWTVVATADELPPGQMKEVEVAGLPVAVFNVEGRYYATEDVCTHDGGPLAQGVLEGYEVECPRHGARFDVRSGKVTRLPAFEPIQTYEVRMEGGEVQIRVEA